MSQQLKNIIKVFLADRHKECIEAFEKMAPETQGLYEPYLPIGQMAWLADPGFTDWVSQLVEVDALPKYIITGTTVTSIPHPIRGGWDWASSKLEQVKLVKADNSMFSETSMDGVTLEGNGTDPLTGVQGYKANIKTCQIPMGLTHSSFVLSDSLELKGDITSCSFTGDNQRLLLNGKVTRSVFMGGTLEGAAHLQSCTLDGVTVKGGEGTLTQCLIRNCIISGPESLELGGSNLFKTLIKSKSIFQAGGSGVHCEADTLSLTRVAFQDCNLDAENLTLDRSKVNGQVTGLKTVILTGGSSLDMEVSSSEGSEITIEALDGYNTVSGDLGATPVLRLIVEKGTSLSLEENLKVGNVSAIEGYVSGTLYVKGQNFNGITLKGNWAKAQFMNCSFQGCQFQGDWSETAFYDCKFNHADLRGVNMVMTRMYGADLSGADLSGADFTDAHLKGALLNETVLFETLLTRANLMDSTFASAVLAGVKIHRAILPTLPTS